MTIEEVEGILQQIHELELEIGEADECGIDYGTYRGLRTLGKTHEEIKVLYGGNETAHAHAGKSTRRAGGAMGVKLA